MHNAALNKRCDKGWPLTARARQPALPVIGLLGTQSLDENVDRLRVFLQGLGKAGYVDGRNVTIEYRSAEGHGGRWSGQG
jgi:putative tryptophan/tyrosine transport system substrate-binding protein